MLEKMLFDTIGAMTGGLITDIYTVLVALFSISFLCMGFNLIKRAFESIRENRKKTLLLEERNGSRVGARGGLLSRNSNRNDEEDC